MSHQPLPPPQVRNISQFQNVYSSNQYYFSKEFLFLIIILIITVVSFSDFFKL